MNIFYRIWKGSISRQLMLGITFVHTLLMSIFVYDLVHRETDFMLVQSKVQAIGLAETLAVNSSSWVLSSDYLGIEELIDAQSGFPDLEFAMLTDLSGKVLGFTHRKEIGQYISDETSLKMLAAHSTIVLIDNRSVIDVAVPITAGHEPIGWARTRLKRETIIQNIEILSRNGLLYTFLAILVGIVFAQLMARGMSRDIRELLLSAKKVQRGQRDVDFKLKRYDELGELSQELTDTLKVLAKSELDLKIEHERIAVTLNSIGDAVIVTDTVGVINAINPVASALTGFSEEEALNKPLESVFNIIDPVSRKKIDNPVNSVFQSDSVIDLDSAVLLVAANKTECPIMDNAAPIRNKNGDILGVILVFQDVSKQVQHETLIKQSEARFRELYNQNPAMFITLNEHSIICSINEYALEQLGYQQGELIGQSIDVLVDKDDREIAEHLIQSCLLHPQQVHRREIQQKCKDGHNIIVRISGRASFDHQNQVSILTVCEDITESYTLSKELAYQATHDALTGLANRLQFENKATQLLQNAQQEGREHVLCFMDLDQFKVVNDTCGHVAGDELLRQLSAVLKQRVRLQDTLARLGGDEFGVLMSNCPLDYAQSLALKLKRLIQDYQFSWEGHSFKIGVSMGLVNITRESKDIADVLKKADIACYSAKDAGRNRVHTYTDDDASLAERHGEMQWVTHIHQALAENRFCLFAQLIKPFRASNKAHYELLIRMQDKEGRIIPPGAYLPAAERYNIITQLDRWVIKEAFGLLHSSPEFVGGLACCSINLSGPSLVEVGFQEFVIECLNSFDIRGEQICFEITETSAIANLTVAVDFITSLKRLGCTFALDDFGSGLSSFGYLKNLPVDYLKIDGLFVKDIVDDPIDLAMVKSINEIGHVMGMKTIAEFVESAEILDILAEIKVDYAQGYHIGKPVLFSDILVQYSKATIE